jgi:hypothetical protein
MTILDHSAASGAIPLHGMAIFISSTEEAAEVYFFSAFYLGICRGDVHSPTVNSAGVK